MEEDKIKALYEQMKGDGYELDDEATFRNDLQNDASFRETIYNAQKDNGYDMGGDFDAWQGRLMQNFAGYGTNNGTAAAPKTMSQQEYAGLSSVGKEVADGVGVQVSEKQPTNEERQAEWERKQHEYAIAGAEMRRKAAGTPRPEKPKPTLEERKAYQDAMVADAYQNIDKPGEYVINPEEDDKKTIIVNTKDYTDRLVGNLFAEADRRVQEMSDASTDYSAWGAPDDISAMQNARKANEVLDPEAIKKQALEYLKKDEEAIKQRAAANARELQAKTDKYINAEDYVNYVYNRTVIDTLAKVDYIATQRMKPKTTSEGVLGGIMDGITGSIVDAAINTPGNVKARQRGVEEWSKDAGMWGRVGRGTVSFLADAPYFGMTGEISGATIQAVTRREIGALMERGLTKKAAERVVTEQLGKSFGQRVADATIKGIEGGAINLGAYEGMAEAARQTATGEFSPKDILGAAAHGAMMGGVLGVTGGPWEAVTSKMGGAKKILANIAGFGIEAGTFTATGDLEKWATGNTDKIDWGEDFLESVSMLVGMKFPKGFIKMFDPSKRPERFNAAESRELKNSPEGTELMNAIEGKDSMSVEEAYGNVMKSKDISFVTKQKLAYMLTKQMVSKTPMVVGYDIEDIGGKTYLSTKSAGGDVVERIEFKNRKEAEDYGKRMDAAIEKGIPARNFSYAVQQAKNEVAREWGFTENEDGMTRFNEIMSKPYDVEPPTEEEMSLITDEDIDLVRRGRSTGDRIKDDIAKEWLDYQQTQQVKQAVVDRFYELTDGDRWTGKRLDGESARLLDEADPNIHEDGTYHKATMYPDASNPDDTGEVFVTKGNLATRKDGSVDVEASSKEIYYRDVNGVKHVASPDKFEKGEMPITVEEMNAAGETRQTRGLLIEPGTELAAKDGNGTVSIDNVNPDGTYNVTVIDNTTGEEEPLNGITYDELMGLVDEPELARLNEAQAEGVPIFGELEGTGENNTTNELQPVRKSVLGNVYNQFKGRFRDAIDFLRKHKEGVAEAALYHKDVGDIDIAWGDEKSGLSHILAKHPEVTDNLQDIVDDMIIAQQSDNRIVLESGTHKAVVSKMKGNEMTPNWLLTAYEKKKPVSASSSDIETEPEGKQNGTATLQSGLSADKDTENIGNDQANAEENAARTPAQMELDTMLEEYADEKDGGIQAARNDISQTISGVTKRLNKAREAMQKPIDRTDERQVKARQKAREEYSQLQTTLEHWRNVSQELSVRSNEAQRLAEMEAARKRAEEKAAAEREIAERVLAEEKARREEEQRKAQEEKEASMLLPDGLPRDAEVEKLFDSEAERADGETDKRVTVTQAVEYINTRFHLQGADWFINEKIKDAASDDARAFWESVKAEQERITNSPVEDDAMLYGEERDVSSKELNEYVANGDASARAIAASALRSGGLDRESIRNSLGIENADMQGYSFLTSNNGRTIESIAHSLWEQYPEKFGTDADAAEMLRDVLSEVKTTGDFRRIIEEEMSKSDLTADEADMMEQQRQAAVEEIYGIPYADVVAYEERMIPEIIRKYADLDENELINLLNETDNGHNTESETGDSVLPETQSSYTARRGAGEDSREVERTGSEGAVEDGEKDEEPSGIELGHDTPEGGTQKAETAEGQRVLADAIAEAEKQVNTEPTEAQKEAGNYKKGHVKVDGFDITIEQPKGSVRSGVDADGKEWSQTMNNTYGYIRGTEGVDGDHIDVFLSGFPELGDIFVVDQYNPDGTFDEHKVMYGYANAESAMQDYLANYEKGWEKKRRLDITGVTYDEFKKWVDSSHRKTKPFAEYKGVKTIEPAKKTQRTDKIDEEISKEYAEVDKLEQDWEDKITDYLYEHYPTQATVSGESKTEKGKQEREAMKNDPVLQKMLADKKVELDAALKKADEKRKTEPTEVQKEAGGVRKPTKGERAVGEAVVNVVRDAGIDVVTDADEMRAVLKDGAERAQEMAVEEANARFDKQLDDFKAKTQKGLMNLGRPQAKLLAAGIDDVELTLDPGVLHRHLEKHGLTTDDLKGLAAAIQEPILVYRHGKDIANKVVVTELDANGGKLSISLKLDENGRVVEINNVRSVHAKEATKELERLTEYSEEELKEALGWVDKEKVSDWFNVAGLSVLLHDKSNPKYDSVAKVLENFENPKVSDGILQKMNVWHGSPYSFEAFDHSNMGNGEGAQAHGWGTYVAKRDAVARRYAGQNGVSYVGDSSDLTDREYSVLLSELLPEMERAYRKWDVEPAEFLNDVVDSENGSLSYDKEMVEVAKKVSSEDFATGTRNLYEVEIPEDNGKIYLDENAILDENEARRIVKGLLENEDCDDYVLDKIEQYLDENNIDGRTLYSFVTNFGFNGNAEATSKAFAELGYKGIKYNGRQDGECFVIFDEADAKIVNHTQFLKTPRGDVYGFVKDGRMYLDMDMINPNTPIHEYGHLWDNALMKTQPEMWEQWKDLVRGSEVWNEVANDPNYADIAHDENLVASEVKSRLTGEEGEERLKRMADDIDMTGSPMDVAKDLTFIQKVKDALKRMWEATKDWLLESNVFKGKFTTEQIKSMSVEDFINKTLKDLAEGVNPKEEARRVDGETAKGITTMETQDDARFRFIGEKGAENADKTEGVTTRMDNLKVAGEMEEAGKDAKAIKLATGWERGKDGKWRYEEADFDIDANGKARKNTLWANLPWGKEYDALADKMLDDEPLTNEELRRFDELSVRASEMRKVYDEAYVRYLDDYVKDDTVFKEYPELKTIRVEFYNEPGNHASGSYNHKQRTIRLNEASISDFKGTPLADEGIRETLVHEVQHAIQHIEGFARGGNRGTYQEYLKSLEPKAKAWLWRNDLEEKAKEMPDATPFDVQNALEKECEELGMTVENGFLPDTDTRIKGFNLWTRGYDEEGYEDSYKKWKELGSKHGLALDGTESYRRLAGEVEARNASQRMDMTDEQRRGSLASETEDVKRDDQIVMYGEGDNASMQEKPVPERGESPLEYARRMAKWRDSMMTDKLLSRMEAKAEEAPELELSPENWTAEFGEDGKVLTPVGEVKMGENQYLKLLKRNRQGYFGMVKPTLTSPDIVLEEHDPVDGAERDSKYLFVKTFRKPDGGRIVHFESVTVKRDNLEVSISSHELEGDAVKRKVQQDKLLYLDEKFSSSEGRLAEPLEEGSDLVPTPNFISSALNNTTDTVETLSGNGNDTDTPENTVSSAAKVENISESSNISGGNIEKTVPVLGENVEKTVPLFTTRKLKEGETMWKKKNSDLTDANSSATPISDSDRLSSAAEVRKKYENPNVSRANILPEDDIMARGGGASGATPKPMPLPGERTIDYARRMAEWRDAMMTDKQGNPVGKDGRLLLDDVASMDELTDKDFTEPTRNVRLPKIPENVDNAIGANGKPVVIKKNIFEKNLGTHSELTPSDSREILKKALYNPHIAGTVQPLKRPDYRVAIHLGDKNSVVVLDVYAGKDNVEIVGWRKVDAKGLEKMKKQAEREDGQLLILSPENGSAAALSALPSDASEEQSIKEDDLILNLSNDRPAGNAVNDNLSSAAKVRKKYENPNVSRANILPEDDIMASGGGTSDTTPKPKTYEERLTEAKATASKAIDKMAKAVSGMKGKSRGEIAQKSIAAQEEARKAVADFIKAGLDSRNMTQFGKRELNRIMGLVENVKSVRMLQNHLTLAERVIADTEIGKQLSAIKDLVRMKKQGKNSRGVSIAKSVDDRTRKIFEYIKGRTDELLVTPIDKDINALNTEIRELSSERKRLEEDAETNAERIAEIDTRMEEIKAEKKGLYDRRDELRQQNREDFGGRWKGRFDELTAKLNDEDEALTDAEYDELEALTILNIINDADLMSTTRITDRETGQMSESIQSLVDKQNGLLERNKELRRERHEAKEEDKPFVTRQIEANKDEIMNLDTAINSIKEQQIGKYREAREMLDALVEGGRERLKDELQREKERQGEIAQNAYDDVSKGKDWKQYDRKGNEKDLSRRGRWSNMVHTLFDTPLESFTYMSQKVSNRLAGTGYLYRRFIEGNDGVVAAHSNHVAAMRKATDMLNAKTQEMFGKDFDKVAADNKKVYNDSGVFTHKDGHNDELRISKGTGMYLRQLWNMKDGRMKLMNMGFTEDSMAQVDDFIGPHLAELADWMVSEYYPQLRERTNERHKEIYHTSMANVDNYVPIRIDKQALKGQSDMVSGAAGSYSESLQKRNGSLVNRTVNVLPIDLSRTAFDVLAEHTNTNEEWIAYARVRQDLDYLLNSRAFRNTLNANSRGSYKDFEDAVRVAVNLPAEPMNPTDSLFNVASAGVVSGAISFKLNTALKQLLSFPAFYAYSQHPRFIAGLTARALTPWNNYKWAKENLPSFAKRIEEGLSGSSDVQRELEALQDGMVKKGMQAYTKWGMLPNKLVDAITCAAGARAVYEYEYRRAKERGMDNDKAHEWAARQADIAYNETQQSNVGAFKSAAQTTTRSWANRMTTVFQNSNLGYTRKNLLALSDIVKGIKDYDRLVGQYAADFEVSRDEAKKAVNNSIRKAVVTLGILGYVVKALWDVGNDTMAQLLGLTGDGDDEKYIEEEEDKLKLAKDIMMYAGYLYQGTIGGNILHDVPSNGAYNPFSILTNSEAKRVSSVYDKYGVSLELATQMLTAAGDLTGFKLDTWANASIAMEDLIMNGADADMAMDVALALNMPKGTREKIARSSRTQFSPMEYAKAMAYARKQNDDSGVLKIIRGTSELDSKKFNEAMKEWTVGELGNDGVKKWNETKEFLKELGKYDSYRLAEAEEKEFEKSHADILDSERYDKLLEVRAVVNKAESLLKAVTKDGALKGGERVDELMRIVIDAKRKGNELMERDVEIDSVNEAMGKLYEWKPEAD